MLLLSFSLISKQNVPFRFTVDMSSEDIFLSLVEVCFRLLFLQDGWSPIHAAVDSGNVDSLKLLMYYGEPNNGNSLPDMEPNSNYFDLESREDGCNSRRKPVISADLINHADKEGWTAAHIAASKGFKVSPCEQVTVTCQFM